MEELNDYILTDYTDFLLIHYQKLWAKMFILSSKQLLPVFANNLIKFRIKLSYTDYNILRNANYLPSIMNSYPAMLLYDQNVRNMTVELYDAYEKENYKRVLEIANAPNYDFTILKALLDRFKTVKITNDAIIKYLVLKVNNFTIDDIKQILFLINLYPYQQINLSFILHHILYHSEVIPDDIIFKMIYYLVRFDNGQLIYKIYNKKGIKNGLMVNQEQGLITSDIRNKIYSNIMPIVMEMLLTKYPLTDKTLPIVLRLICNNSQQYSIVNIQQVFKYYPQFDTVENNTMMLTVIANNNIKNKIFKSALFAYLASKYSTAVYDLDLYQKMQDTKFNYLTVPVQLADDTMIDIILSNPQIFGEFTNIKDILRKYNNKVVCSSNIRKILQELAAKNNIPIVTEPDYYSYYLPDENI